MITEFGKLLRTIRIDFNESAKDMADKLDISLPYLSAIETGKRDIPSDMEEVLLANYNFSDEYKANIRDAIIASKDKLKIDFAEFSEPKKRAIFALAKDDIDSETIKQICDLVNSKKGENK